MSAEEESAARASADSGVVAAGPAAVNAFHHVLGIPPSLRDSGAYQVRKIVWTSGVLRIDVTGRGFDRAVLCVRQGAHRVEVSVDGPTLALHPAVERLLESARRRLARTPVEALLELIRRDPGSVSQVSDAGSGSAGRPRDGVNLVPRPYVHEWTGKPGELGQWGLFFDDLVFVYTGFTRVNFVLPTTHVMHGNHECLCVTPKLRTRSAWIFNYPRRSSSPTSDGLRASLGMPPQYVDKPFRRLSTDMTELDTVMGGDDKLGQALRVAANGDGERLIGVHKTCLPKVMGDDVDRPLELVRNTPGVHCLSYCMGFTHDQHLYAEELEFGPQESKVMGQLLAPGRRGTLVEQDHASGKTFDLVGFPDGADTAELVSLLEACGAKAGALLLPDIDVPLFLRTPRPEVQVRFPNRYFERLYREVFDQLADRVVAPAAPFGLRATETWLKASTSALGLHERGVEEALQRAKEACRPRWNALSSLARGLRLGFVVDPRVLPRLVDPQLSFGLSMPDMLAEMGFGIDLLCYAPEGDSGYARSAIASGDVRLHPFRDERELHVRLREGEFKAVYSDRCFERRLSANGKAWFGFGDFEMGFQGAVRSLERLVRACSLPFYQRHARYLGRGAS